MQPIELYTAEDGYVTTVEVPTLVPPTDVIIWGLRVFVLDREARRYRETFPYVVPLEESED